LLLLFEEWLLPAFFVLPKLLQQHYARNQVRPTVCRV
jgi:hypothetical protein